MAYLYLLIKNYDEESDRGYLFVVDVEYTKNLKKAT